MATTLSSLETQIRRHLVELPALSDPSAPTIAPQGTTGATAYSYKVVALHAHGQTAASSAGSTATGNATLSSTNFNRLTWTAVTGATAYKLFRTAAGGSSPTTTGLIGIVGDVAQFDDTGLAGDSATAPTANTSGNRFWSSAELIDILNQGIKNLWGALIDLFEDHFQTIDTTNVTLAADATSLAGVPSDVFRVLLIEPADTTSAGSTRHVRFIPRRYNSDDFINARAQDALDPSTAGVIFYEVTQPGPPTAAPTILTAPKLSSAMSLRLAYIPTQAAVAAAGNNPIPGESDMALIAYGVAFARAKEREDRSPDPNWLKTYDTEKQGLLVRLTPRQEQEPEVVEGVFDGYQ